MGEDAYLTSGQAARRLGVSKRTVLRAASRGDLPVAQQLPGGALRFRAADLDAALRPQVGRAAGAPLQPDRPAERGALLDGVARLARAATADPADSGTLIDDTLALLADVLQVGAAFLAHAGGTPWLIERAHDRMGLGLAAGAPVPLWEGIGAAVESGDLPVLIVADLQRDARFAADAYSAAGIGSYAAVRLAHAGGRAPGLLGIVDPAARSIAPAEVSLLQLAGRIITQAIDLEETLRAERRLAQGLAEAERFARGVLDALSAAVAVLDESGTIVVVNAAWRAFARANGGGASCGEGTSYLRVCDEARGEGAEEARAFAAGIRGVLGGALSGFALEYPCHGPGGRRWFIGRVSPFAGPDPARAVVAHEDITARRLAVEGAGQPPPDLPAGAPCA